MKRNLLIAALLGGLTASSFAQGVITIGASAGKIKYTTDGVTLISAPVGNPDNIAGFGAVHVTVYAASNGTVLPTSGLSALGAIPAFNSSWFIAASGGNGGLIQNFAPSAGGFSATTLTMDAGAGGVSATEQLEVVGWTGAFTTFQAALASGTSLIGWGGSSLIAGGSAFTFSFATGDGLGNPGTIANGATTFNGLVLAPVPEPGTMLLVEKKTKECRKKKEKEESK